MITIPIWVFVILCIFTGIALLGLLILGIDLLSYMIYQEHEWQKYKNKINSKE